jgi:hypothetical protein
MTGWASAPARAWSLPERITVPFTLRVDKGPKISFFAKVTEQAVIKHNWLPSKLEAISFLHL